MSKPTLARLELPDDAILLYEQMVIGDPDRTGNWRFFIDSAGCLFTARNSQLFVTDAAQQASDEPTLFWSTPFAAQPDRCLSAAQLAELQDALDGAELTGLSDYYADPAFARTSSPAIERWTITHSGAAQTIVVELKARPQGLDTLYALVNRLISAAAKP